MVKTSLPTPEPNARLGSNSTTAMASGAASDSRRGRLIKSSHMLADTIRRVTEAKPVHCRALWLFDLHCARERAQS